MSPKNNLFLIIIETISNTDTLKCTKKSKNLHTIITQFTPNSLFLFVIRLR